MSIAPEITTRRRGAVPVPGAQNTPAWLDARKDVIGSSDISVLTGNSTYGSSKVDVWAVKTRLLEPAQPDEATQELFDLGHALEPIIAARYALEYGPVQRRNRLLKHPSLPFVGASLDRVQFEGPARHRRRIIVEIKWAPHRRWSDGPEPVPAAVQDQAQWQLLTTGYDLVRVPVLNGSHVEYHEIEPDQSYQDDLLYIARDFWGYVERREIPPLDGSEATRKVITRLHPRDLLPMLEGNELLDSMVERLRQAQGAFAIAEEELGTAKNALRLRIGDAAGIDGDGYRIDFRKNADSAKTDWKLVAKAYRAVIDETGVLDAAAFVGMSDLDAIERLYTQVKEGARPLVPRFAKEEKASWS